MVLDDRYPVLETLKEESGVTLYRVEGGWVFFFHVKTPEDRERFFRYRAAVRRLEELGLVEAQISAKPGRHYVFFPERPYRPQGPAQGGPRGPGPPGLRPGAPGHGRGPGGLPGPLAPEGPPWAPGSRAS
jgi:hypothetical protein